MLEEKSKIYDSFLFSVDKDKERENLLSAYEINHQSEEWANYIIDEDIESGLSIRKDINNFIKMADSDYCDIVNRFKGDNLLRYKDLFEYIIYEFSSKEFYVFLYLLYKDIEKLDLCDKSNIKKIRRKITTYFKSANQYYSFGYEPNFTENEIYFIKDLVKNYIDPDKMVKLCYFTNFFHMRFLVQSTNYQRDKNQYGFIDVDDGEDLF